MGKRRDRERQRERERERERDASDPGRRRPRSQFTISRADVDAGRSALGLSFFV